MTAGTGSVSVMLPARGLKCFPSSGPDPFRDDANDSACIVSSGCTPRPDADPRIEKIVASVSKAMKELLTKLVSFGTRNTLSDPGRPPTRGIGAARNWILEEMRRSSEKLKRQLRHASHRAAGPHHRQIELRNMVAILPASRRGASTSAAITTRSTSAARTSPTPRRPAPPPPAATARPAPTSMPTSTPTAPTTTAAARC